MRGNCRHPKLTPKQGQTYRYRFRCGVIAIIVFVGRSRSGTGTVPPESAFALTLWSIRDNHVISYVRS